MVPEDKTSRWKCTYVDDLTSSNFLSASVTSFRRWYIPRCRVLRPCLPLSKLLILTTFPFDPIRVLTLFLTATQWHIAMHVERGHLSPTLMRLCRGNFEIGGKGREAHRWHVRIGFYSQSPKNSAKVRQSSQSDKQVGQLSQPNRTAACVSFGKNISAKSMHLTSFYPTALTSTNDHLTVSRHYVCT